MGPRVCLIIPVLINLVFVSGCCILRPKPCCYCHEDVTNIMKIELSAGAIKELDQLNASMAKDMYLKNEVRLEVCKNLAMSSVVVPEVVENIKISCNAPVLSEKQHNDCLSSACGARLKAEWCDGLADVIEQHLTECEMFRYDGRNCTYTESSVN